MCVVLGGDGTQSALAGGRGITMSTVTPLTLGMAGGADWFQKGSAFRHNLVGGWSRFPDEPKAGRNQSVRRNRR